MVRHRRSNGFEQHGKTTLCRHFAELCFKGEIDATLHPDPQPATATGSAALLAGQPLITIDNVNGKLMGDALCQIIARPRPQVRILGKSELIDVETRGTTLFANGNNISVFGDLCRRVVRIRLDPKMENPKLKTFKGNPVTTVLADRGAYVAAALTVCRAYIVVGRPRSPAGRGAGTAARKAPVGQGDDATATISTTAEAKQINRWIISQLRGTRALIKRLQEL